MCAIVDTNVFGLVFNKKNDGHEEFAPINAWLYKGKGKLVYGGAKYSREIKGGLFTRTLVELSRMGKTVLVPPKKVDDYAKWLKTVAPENEFDDEHLVALVALSGC